MALTIYHPVGFNEAGGRPNNEDSIYPATGKAGVNDRLFLVCDGVGGQHKGEVASALACETISRFFFENQSENISEAYVAHAVRAAHHAFRQTEEAYAGAKGMATTMTLLYLNESGAALAHLGDSRIYQVRDGHIIYRTKDHKWVNELVESGVITQEQAREHPKKNVITRVITASRLDQPDYVFLSDVRKDDFFFLCTDGVLERMYEELLEYHLRADSDNHAESADILEAIRSECADKTRDNFSAYLIKIKAPGPGANSLPKQEAEAVLPVQDKSNAAQTAGASQADGPPHKPRGILLSLVAFAFIFWAILVIYLVKDKKPNDKLAGELIKKADADAADSTAVPASEQSKIPIILEPEQP